MKMRILVTGSDGLVGTDIIPILENDFDVVPYVESQWDICNPEQSEDVISEVAPDVLLNLAAITNVDGCEDNQDLPYRVNGYGAGLLSEICSRHGVRIISFSTDYVFDGKKTSPYVEDDATNPLSVYGKSKLEGERRVLSSNTASIIIRTEWIYGTKGESFITKVLRRAQEAGHVEVVDDQTGTPTYAKDLAHPLTQLINTGAQGIFHVTNSGFCTWYGFAGRIFSRLRMDMPCAPIKTVQSARKAIRPAYSVLSGTKLINRTGVIMRPWEDALDEYLSEMALL
jgi:dTDP-4-dehydrorhamnose reductase